MISDRGLFPSPQFDPGLPAKIASQSLLWGLQHYLI